jgi:hypothetical protein
MDKIDTEIRFAGMTEERLRREDPHYIRTIMSGRSLMTMM